MRIILLTRPATAQGVAIVDAFARHGLSLAGVVLEPKTVAERRKRLMKVYRENGLLGTVLKVGRILLEDRLPGLLRRGGAEATPTVEAARRRRGVAVHSVANHNDPSCEGLLRSLAPDVVLLAGTRIIKPNILAVPRVGTVNAHTGWLPDYRGRNANLWAFLEGGPTGITTHFVDPGVDTGAILLREPFPIGPGDTLQRLEQRAALQCAEMMVKTVRGLADGTIQPQPQRGEEGRQFPALPVSLETELRRRLRGLPAGRSPEVTRR